MSNLKLNKQITISKFIEKYLFIFKVAAEGWRVKRISKNKYEFINNINKVKKPLLDASFFINYYKSSSL